MGSMPKADAKPKVKIRPAAARDAEAIAALSTQLGYPSNAAQIVSRLEQIRDDADHAVFVAELSNGQIIGWVHVKASYLVANDPEAEIGGLVVDEAHRGSGIGRLLMEQAEQWGREKGLKSVYLRSNVIRKDGHVFYQRLGYSIIKVQYAFRKIL
jgi:GNAT superfamily N-acetyltransferase